MRALVTGAAGFIGSHLAEELLQDGHEVLGVDAITPYYDPAVKRRNLQLLLGRPGFTFVEGDLLDGDLTGLVAERDAVFHLAGQPGVRKSWADGFREYVDNNVVVTQRLLEACRGVAGLRFVYASSSSVYGQAPEYPTRETDVPLPHSPYGVTKLGGEQLCGLYAANHGLATTMLRYFTVYGPRQRPDMGIHRFVQRALDGQAIELFGTGEQVRDFTFVSDVVRATYAAGLAADVPPGSVVNIAGGSSVTVNQVLSMLSELVDRELVIRRRPPQPGDVDVTGGSISRARQLLSWQPRVELRTGLAAQVDWHLRQPDVVGTPGRNGILATARR